MVAAEIGDLGNAAEFHRNRQHDQEIKGLADDRPAVGFPAQRALRQGRRPGDALRVLNLSDFRALRSRHDAGLRAHHRAGLRDTRVRQRQDYADHVLPEAGKKGDKYQEYNLLNASEIRTILEDTALMVAGARNPVLMKVTPHYQNPAFAKALRDGAAPRPQQAVHDPLVPRVRV